MIKNDLNNEIKKNFLLKKIWCASSTHPGEELLCANVHKKLKDAGVKLLTIIIPRHIHRTTEIINQINSRLLKNSSS